MYGHNLVAIYQSFSDAEKVRDRLMAEGFIASDVRLSGDRAARPATVQREEEPGFWAWLFGDVPDTDRTVYRTHLQANRAIVSVLVRDEARRERALDIMEEFDPIDVDDQGTGGPPPVQRMSTTMPPPGRAGAPVTGAVPPAAAQRGTEQVIPVVKEELSVGKRVTERHYRVRTHVVEKPIEEQVMLRDERVTIEHRPVSGAAAARPGMPQEREVEIVERHEEPVAEKHGRVAEEIVVRKEVTERPETVRGTVQETRVDVDKDAAAAATGTAAPRNPNIRR